MYQTPTDAGTDRSFMTLKLLACWLLGGVGCVSATGSASRQNLAPLKVIVGTVEETVVIQRTADSAYFDVTAVGFNLDTLPVTFYSRVTPVQTEINGVWTTVFATNFASGMTRLAPGDSGVVPIRAFGYTKPDIYPQWNPKMRPGRYRLLFGVGRDVRGPPTQVQPSTTFIVK
jgi:hypothetical protein